MDGAVLCGGPGGTAPGGLGRLDGLDWAVATDGELAAPVAPVSPSAPFGSGHFHHWADDVRRIVGAGPATRRLVLGWGRLQPDGPGTWDRAALDRCDRALDTMAAAGVLPAVALMYRELPAWLEEGGGWLSRDTASRFADYADAMGRRFGDRVARWVTLSDVAASSLADRVAGLFAPGRARGAAGLPAVHHVLLAHGLAMRALRAAGVRGRAGLIGSLVGAYTASTDPWDRIALERLESWSIRLFLDPLLLGEHMVLETGRSPVVDSGCVRTGDMKVISTPQDALGLSWHAPMCVAAPENVSRVLSPSPRFHALNEVNRLLARLGFAVVPLTGVETTSYGWPVVPEGPADALAMLHELYGDALPPVYITDRGLDDHHKAAGLVRPDRDRCRSALASKLAWLARIMNSDGVDVVGYEYWSVLDDVASKLPYCRLYASAVGDGESAQDADAPPPMIPCDWVRSGVFGNAS
ncbi:family 1 glycosylhydrolase [Actinomadura vinacea]|uniref:Family 1 glycosylhydrolase n=1 Tax=Actinomadura vinacea TaxID=115336 RepID=A0ABN3INN6_9ACTN